MTADEFQKRYHEYIVKDRNEALAEIEGMEPVEGHMVVAVHFPSIGWALMLDTAASFMGFRPTGDGKSVQVT